MVLKKWGGEIGGGKKVRWWEYKEVRLWCGEMWDFEKTSWREYEMVVMWGVENVKLLKKWYVENVSDS